MGKITSIVLTGGPCGGKSTSLATIEQELTNKGYLVITPEEMATNVINSGVRPDVVGVKAFEKLLIKMQYDRDNNYIEMLTKLLEGEDKDIIVVYDRGIQDCKAFITDEQYTEILNELGLSEIHILEMYDGVFNLVTAANGAVEHYTLANNKARTETPEEAIERDNDCIRAWTGHSHLRIIDNKNKTFEQKIDKLLEEVYMLLGIPVPVEIERKYLIEMPDMEELHNKYKCTTVDIIQTYLVEKENGVERRIRQRGVNGHYTFYYTEKQKINELSRVENERKITESEYLQLLMEADTELHQIRKQRTCFVCDNTYFELDVYPFWKDKAIIEIELTNESTTVELPKEIKLIKEVTDNDNYKNNSLAKSLGNVE